jgi:hypothetical protein
MIQPVTSIMCAQARRSSPFAWAFVLILISWILVSSANAQTSSGETIYLLSGTPSNQSGESFPVTLYGVAADRKLKLVRELVPQKEGLYSVKQASGVLFVAHPHITPTVVTILHTGNLLQSDDVLFNPKGLVSLQSFEALSEASQGSIEELFPLVDAGGLPRNGILVSISGRSAEGQPRLTFDTWEKYRTMETDGTPGGPSLYTGPFAVVNGRNLAVSIFGRKINVDTLPPSLQVVDPSAIAWLMIFNKEYSIVAMADTTPGHTSNAAGSRRMFVHNRIKNRWTQIDIQGSDSRLRVLGPWLATIVAMKNPDHRSGPGRANERSVATDRLPNVQKYYSDFIGQEFYLPGILVLQNLVDGRKIQIETGEEDSEILQVKGEMVLYRVNDSIYEARIAGDEIKDPGVVVKDEDVPEIHWAFWSE